MSAWFSTAIKHCSFRQISIVFKSSFHFHWFLLFNFWLNMFCPRVNACNIIHWHLKKEKIDNTFGSAQEINWCTQVLLVLNVVKPSKLEFNCIQTTNHKCLHLNNTSSWGGKISPSIIWRQRFFFVFKNSLWLFITLKRKYFSKILINNTN